jgi:hypothetical protein
MIYSLSHSSQFEFFFFFFAHFTILHAIKMDACAKLRKVVEELLVTEISYVTGMQHLLVRYVTPLSEEQFLRYSK